MTIQILMNLNVLGLPETEKDIYAIIFTMLRNEMIGANEVCYVDFKPELLVCMKFWKKSLCVRAVCPLAILHVNIIKQEQHGTRTWDLAYGFCTELSDSHCISNEISDWGDCLISISFRLHLE
ncbi:hypothetical protein AVEN_241031-1 [Araneus ventricosus]|uniref:Uncharacterized protein n=1 Tax=Araneus ventricosus TaxID=182803 RepID=A0A4Y2URU4_ARAVE|nr:hypothetical protein AVEN_241031-1 [Araneus ventricosus]